MHSNQKDRLKSTITYVGLGVLVVATIAMLIYLVGSPGWNMPILDVKKR